MTREKSHLVKQSTAGIDKRADPLENQLEKLFSDVDPSKPTATFRGPRQPTRAKIQQNQAPSFTGTLIKADKKQLFKPKWTTAIRLLSVLAPFVVLAFLLVDQSLARPTDAVILPAPTTNTVTRNIPSTRVAIIAPTAPTTPTATRPPSTATPTQPPATSTRGSLTATATHVPATFTPTSIPATDTPQPTNSAVPATSTPKLPATPAPTAVGTDVPQPTAASTSTATPPSPTPVPPSPNRLQIPSINLEAPIVTVGYEHYEINGQPVTTWVVPGAFAVGWHHTSAPPGQPGNTVINGHQNIYGRVFRNLVAVQPGDEITLFIGDVIHHYRVAERHILAEEGQPLEVRVQNAQWIMPTQDERLTLVTCSPDNQSTHRLIVVAFPVNE